MILTFQKGKQFVYDNRLFFIVPLQVLIIVIAFLLSFVVRFDLSIPYQYWLVILKLLPILLVIKMITFLKMGLFKGWWRYVSMPDLILVLKGNLLASTLFIIYAVFVHRLQMIPRSVLLLDGVFCFLFMGGIRFATRAIRENYLPINFRHKNGERLLIVGAGDAGQSIARELRSNPALEMVLVGFIDDDPLKKNGLFQGCKVLGEVAALPVLCKAHGITEVVIAIPSASGKQVRMIVEKCREAEVQFKILPGVGELIDGRISMQLLRDVDLEDLLGRKPIVLDRDQIRNYLQGKRVLITGAGGSIGSEICRQVAGYKPEKLILFENAETPLFHIEQELAVTFPDVHLVPIIGDVRNLSRVNGIFDAQMPQVVFHAAAYKHVPMMEANPAEAVNNNVQGTRIVADAAHAVGVENFVMISTDKAVRPTNIMGATKRVAELYVQSLDRKSKTRFVTTRFGNVLGSNGSVIPTFKEQIKNGGPVTVTHPDVTRFFMTIPEATQLVLQAGSMGKGGEIYLFDMGEPVRIVKLAEDLIRLSGLLPYEDIEIVFTGLRPGEKLYEELLLDEEGALPTHHEKICVASAAFREPEVLNWQIEGLVVAAKKIDKEHVYSGLQQIVPEFDFKLISHPNIAKVIPFAASTNSKM